VERRYAQFIAISLAIVLAGQLLQLWLFPKPQRDRKAAEVGVAALNADDNPVEGSSKRADTAAGAERDAAIAAAAGSPGAALAFAEQGLGARATTFGGSFFSDPLPTGADVISLVRVIFDHDDARALMILKAVRRALPADGTLLLTEPMAGTRGAEAMGDAYFGFYLLAMGKGRARSAERLTSMLHEAGFGEVKLVRNPMPLQTQLIVARPRAMENPSPNGVSKD
jgi:hypothetical protein